MLTQLFLGLSFLILCQKLLILMILFTLVFLQQTGAQIKVRTCSVQKCTINIKEIEEIIKLFKQIPQCYSMKQLHFIIFRFLLIVYQDQQKGLFPFVVGFLLLYCCFMLKTVFPCLCKIFQWFTLSDGTLWDYFVQVLMM